MRVWIVLGFLCVLGGCEMTPEEQKAFVEQMNQFNQSMETTNQQNRTHMYNTNCYDNGVSTNCNTIKYY